MNNIIKYILFIILLLAIPISIQVFINNNNNKSNIQFIIWLDNIINKYSNETVYNKHYNSFLKRNYAPIQYEHNNLDVTLVSGALPNDMPSGLFLRIGPNPIQELIGSKRLHKFDGHGMIHSIRIEEEEGERGGRVKYSNQYVQTPRYIIEKQYNKSLFWNYGELKGLIGILKILFMIPLKLKYFELTELTSGPANMNIVVLGSRIYVCDEGSLPFAIRWKHDNTFESVGYEFTNSSSLSNSLSMPMTSHPKVDIKTQTMYFTGYTNILTWNKDATVMYGSAYGTNSLQVIDNTDVILPSRPWVHDMMITENYVLLFAGSIVTTPENDIPNGNLLTFDKNVKFEIGVASKDDADFIVGGSSIKQESEMSKSLQWFRAINSAAVMHAANAWEEITNQNHTVIVLWAPICEGEFDGTFSKNYNKFHMSRVALNLNTGQLRKGTLGTELDVDYPVVHPAYQGYRSMYIFASILDNSSDEQMQIDNEPIGIVKYNVFDKKIDQTIYFMSGVYSGAMIPIPKKKEIDKHGSSDGSDYIYLASFFYDYNTNVSEWRLYDGESMNTEAVAVFQIPVRVPYGSHGEWIKEEVLQSILNDH